MKAYPHPYDCPCCSPIYASERDSREIRQAAEKVLMGAFLEEIWKEREREMENRLAELLLETCGHMDFVC